jgi:hypothetical protein
MLSTCSYLANSELMSFVDKGVFPTLLTWHAAAIDPRYALCHILAPTAKAMDEQHKSESPAPAVSLGAAFIDGSRSVCHT